MMKNKLLGLYFIGLVFLFACGKEEANTPNPLPQLSNQKVVEGISISTNQIDYQGNISGTIISFSQALPYDTKEVSIKVLTISDKTTATLKTGDIIDISGGSYEFEVKAEDNSTQKYTLQVTFEERSFEVTLYNPELVAKTYSTPTFAHYMPWFESPEFAEFPETDKGNWGIHWTMATQNPTTTDENGKRAIASHYSPLIGPYDNGEPHYLEYAVACMKLTGLDGIFIDYASQTDFYDWQLLHDHTKAIIPWLKKAGLQYALVYEDANARIAEENGLGNKKDLARSHIEYMQTHFFTDENYVYHNGQPLLLVFGPQSGMTKSDWSEVVNNEAQLVLLNGQIRVMI